MAEILSIISIVSFVVAGICLIFALFFWFKFKIPSVIGDLSGRTAKKSIAQMRDYNEKSGKKSHRSSRANLESGRITDTMSHSDRLKKSKKVESELSETGLLEDSKPKYVTEETELLADDQNTVLLAEDQGTEWLVDNVPDSVERAGGKTIEQLEEVILIHTNEIIDI